MLNFTGSTRKRVVNLGDRGGVGSRSFLEKAKTDRLLREKDRQRTASATVIQSYVRRFVELHAIASQMLAEWNNSDILKDVDRWCAQVSFISRFGPQKSLPTLFHTATLQLSHVSPQLSEFNTTQLIRASCAALSRTEDPEPVLGLLSALLSSHNVPTRYPRALGATIGQLSRMMNDQNGPGVVEIIFKIAGAESAASLVRFLAQVPRKYLRSASESTLLACFQHPEAEQALQSLAVPDRINVLLNALFVGPKRPTRDSFAVYSRILSATTCFLSLQPEIAFPAYSQSSNTVYLNQADWDLLSVLHSSEFVSHASREVNDAQSPALRFLCQLMDMFPDSRTRISMIITLRPQIAGHLLDMVRNDVVYSSLLEAEAGPDMLTSVHLTNFAKPPHDAFWSSLFTFEQVLSYWLIVASEAESFQNDWLGLDKIREFCRALKAWCLTAIYQPLPSNHWRLKAISKISVALLNQLYMKNLRLKFLPNTFWKPKTLKFNTASMIDSLLRDSDSDDESGDDMAVDEPVSSVPKSRVLTDVPFFIDFADRVKVLQGLIDHDRRQQDSSFLFSSFEDSRLDAEIRRDHALEDAFEAFSSGVDFRKKLSITFVNDYGAEAGIDGGGLTKELLNLAIAEGCNPNNPLSLFKETDDNGLYPNRDIYLKVEKRIALPEQETRLKYLRFMGQLIGKCLYENVLIDFSFAPFFLSKFRVTQNHSKNSIEDLVYLDSELYRNLNKLQGMSAKELESLDLNFAINETIGDKSYTFNLLPGGDSEPVTTTNRLNYIHKMATFKLNQSLGLQTKFFLEGLFQLVRPKWLSIFDPFELQILISGGHDINLEDWKANVNYGGFWETDATIVNFWEVVAEMSPGERCDLLKFVTSVSRAPLLGFGELNPKFAINRGSSTDRLPTASTCVNLLKLPDYKDKATIREKLLYSISANSGFDLS